MGADSRQIKGFCPPITLFGIVDCDDPRALIVPAGGDVEASAIGREHTVANKVFARLG